MTLMANSTMLGFIYLCLSSLGVVGTFQFNKIWIERNKTFSQQNQGVNRKELWEDSPFMIRNFVRAGYFNAYICALLLLLAANMLFRMPVEAFPEVVVSKTGESMPAPVFEYVILCLICAFTFIILGIMIQRLMSRVAAIISFFFVLIAMVTTPSEYKAILCIFSFSGVIGTIMFNKEWKLWKEE
jgi:hypothetical protein